MILHLITAENENGDNLDLLVWASDKKEALHLWDKYYHDSGLGRDPDPRIFTVMDSPHQKARALAWGTDVKEITL